MNFSQCLRVVCFFALLAYWGRSILQFAIEVDLDHFVGKQIGGGHQQGGGRQIVNADFYQSYPILKKVVFESSRYFIPRNPWKYTRRRPWVPQPSLSEVIGVGEVSVNLFGLDLGLKTNYTLTANGKFKLEPLALSSSLLVGTAWFFGGIYVLSTVLLVAILSVVNGWTHYLNPLILGHCFLRLAGTSKWLEIPGEYSALHCDCNPVIFGIAAYCIGRIHLWIVSLTALKVVEVLQVEYASALILHNRLTLAFFVHSFTYLYGEDETSPEPITASPDPITASSDPITASSDPITASQDPPPDRDSLDQASRLRLIRRVYYLSANEVQLLEGRILFLLVQILAAAFGVVVTGKVMKELCPSLLPLRPLPYFATMQHFITPWSSILISLFFPHRLWHLFSTQDVGTAPLSLRWFASFILMILAVTAYLFLIIFWWNLSPSCHGLNKLIREVLIMTGFKECLQSAIRDSVHHDSISIFRWKSDFKFRHGIPEVSDQMKKLGVVSDNAECYIIEDGQKVHALILRSGRVCQVYHKVDNNDQGQCLFLKLPSGVVVSPVLTVLIIVLFLLGAVCLNVGLPAIVGRWAVAQVYALVTFEGVLLHPLQAFEKIQGAEVQSLESLSNDSILDPLYENLWSIRNVAVPTAQIPDLSTFSAGCLVIFLALFCIKRKSP